MDSGSDSDKAGDMRVCRSKAGPFCSTATGEMDFSSDAEAELTDALIGDPCSDEPGTRGAGLVGFALTGAFELKWFVSDGIARFGGFLGFRDRVGSSEWLLCPRFSFGRPPPRDRKFLLADRNIGFDDTTFVSTDEGDDADEDTDDGDDDDDDGDEDDGEDDDRQEKGEGDVAVVDDDVDVPEDAGNGDDEDEGS
jgi:hypothetical protein